MMPPTNKASSTSFYGYGLVTSASGWKNRGRGRMFEKSERIYVSESLKFELFSPHASRLLLRSPTHGAAWIFFTTNFSYHLRPTVWFEPTLVVELHQTGAFEGPSTDWATAYGRTLKLSPSFKLVDSMLGSGRAMLKRHFSFKRIILLSESGQGHLGTPGVALVWVCLSMLVRNDRTESYPASRQVVV